MWCPMIFTSIRKQKINECSFWCEPEKCANVVETLFSHSPHHVILYADAAGYFFEQLPCKTTLSAGKLLTFEIRNVVGVIAYVHI